MVSFRNEGWVVSLLQFENLAPSRAKMAELPESTLREPNACHKPNIEASPVREHFGIISKLECGDWPLQVFTFSNARLGHHDYAGILASCLIN